MFSLSRVVLMTFFATFIIISSPEIMRTLTSCFCEVHSFFLTHLRNISVHKIAANNRDHMLIFNRFWLRATQHFTSFVRNNYLCGTELRMYRSEKLTLHNWLSLGAYAVDFDVAWCHVPYQYVHIVVVIAIYYIIIVIIIISNCYQSWIIYI